MFTFFKYDAPVEITHRNLPHWEQPEVCYFLTFRTDDSLPAEVMMEWKTERSLWLKAHGIVATQEDWHLELEALPNTQRIKFHRTFSKKMHTMLDAGYGTCFLSRKDLREIVVNALHHFDGDRYQLGAFVVMPNHVHVLVQCLGDRRLKKMCYSWKHFTAREINKVLASENVARESSEHSRRDSRATFWQGETYDHIVRSPEQFEHYRRYIAENPIKAKLRDDEYAIYLPKADV